MTLTNKQKKNDSIDKKQIINIPTDRQSTRHKQTQPRIQTGSRMTDKQTDKQTDGGKTKYKHSDRPTNR